MLAFNMLTPRHVRIAMGGRPTNYEAIWRALQVPALVTNGEKDQLITPAHGTLDGIGGAGRAAVDPRGRGPCALLGGHGALQPRARRADGAGGRAPRLSALRLAYLQLALSMALVGANVASAKLLAEALPIAADRLPALRAGLPGAVAAGAADGRARCGWPRARRWNLALQAVFGTAIYNAGAAGGAAADHGAGGRAGAGDPAGGGRASAARCWLRERLPPRQWVAVALAAGGMAAITAGAAAAAGGGGSALGNLLVFGGVLRGGGLCAAGQAHRRAGAGGHRDPLDAGLLGAGAAALRAAGLRRGGGAGRPVRWRRCWSSTR